MKKIQMLVAGGLVSLGLMQAGAASYQDEDSWQTLDAQTGNFVGHYLSAGGASLTFTFDLRAGAPDFYPGSDIRGYDPLTEQVIAATATFSFLNDGDADFPVTEVKVDALTMSFDWNPFPLPGPVPSALFAATDTAALIVTIQDGFANVEIKSTSGDFYVASALLRATTEPRTSQVPDAGGTLALFGIAMSALGLARRQFRS